MEDEERRIQNVTKTNSLDIWQENKNKKKKLWVTTQKEDQWKKMHQ